MYLVICLYKSAGSGMPTKEPDGDAFETIADSNQALKPFKALIT